MPRWLEGAGRKRRKCLVYGGPNKEEEEEDEDEDDDDEYEGEEEVKQNKRKE